MSDKALTDHARVMTVLERVIVQAQGQRAAIRTPYIERTVREASEKLALQPQKLQASFVPLLENDRTAKRHGDYLLSALLRDAPSAVINEYAAYHQLMLPPTNALLLGSLRYYPELPQLDDYSAVPDEMKRQIRGLLNVTLRIAREMESRHRSIHRNGKLHTFDNASDYGLPLRKVTLPPGSHGLTEALIITNPALVQLILDNPGMTSLRISQIIIERNTGDADLIASIINSETPAFTDGNL